LYIEESLLKGQSAGKSLLRIQHPEDGFLTLPTDTLVRQVIEDRLRGEDVGALSYRFHHILADLIAQALIDQSRKTGITRAVLTGGVYQNTLLLNLTRRSLEAGGMTVYTHHLIPPNDGGISLGQALAAQEIITRGLPSAALV
jgi:hydrogenase maturation protein HypF